MIASWLKTVTVSHALLVAFVFHTHAYWLFYSWSSLELTSSAVAVYFYTKLVAAAFQAILTFMFQLTSTTCRLLLKKELLLPIINKSESLVASVISLKCKFIVKSYCLSSSLKCEYGIWRHPSTLEYDCLKIFSRASLSMNHLVYEWNYLWCFSIQSLSRQAQFRAIFFPYLTRIYGLWTNS